MRSKLVFSGDAGYDNENIENDDGELESDEDDEDDDDPSLLIRSKQFAKQVS